MLTAEAEVEQKIRGLRAGADDYLVKPFHPAELLARIKSLLARFAPRGPAWSAGRRSGASSPSTAPRAASARRRSRSTWRSPSSASWGGASASSTRNLQFGDHRVFLDLGLDRKSIVDVVERARRSTPTSCAASSSSTTRRSTCCSRRPRRRRPSSSRRSTWPTIIDVLRGMYDYVVVDVDKRLDDLNLGVFDAAEHLFVVLTADLSCLKNVRLVLETLGHIGYEGDRIKLVLNRSNAFTGINAKTAEGALKRPIDHQVLNEYRGAISALNSGAPVMFTKADSPLGRSLHDFARAIDKAAASGAGHGAARWPRRPLTRRPLGARRRPGRPTAGGAG